MTNTVVSMPVLNQNCLFHFDHRGSPRMCTDQLPFVTIGSGQLTGDPFLAFMQRMFWKHPAPLLSDGIRSAVWTLLHAINTRPGDVTEPIQIVISRKKGEDYRVLEFSKADVELQIQGVVDIESRMVAAATILHEPSTPPPEPPTSKSKCVWFQQFPFDAPPPLNP